MPVQTHSNAKITNASYLERQAHFESNVRSYPRKLPMAIAQAQGCWVTDVEGKRYLDCLAGAGTLAMGHNHPSIIDSIREVLDRGIPLHTLDLTTPLKDRFSECLLSLLPIQRHDYCLQFCGPSGADAVEAAIKLAKTYTGRSSIISFSGAYHGMTHGALAVTGNLAPKTAVPGLMSNVQFLPYPHEYRCPLGVGGKAAERALSYYFEQMLNDVESGVCKPAAVILEAIQGEGGVNPAPIEWLQSIRRVTEQHGILLIVDEVQTGFARTGDMFAYQYANIEPDIVVMSKAVGGGLPLAVLGIKRQFDAWQAGAHTGTFRGNQLAMATGLTTLQYLQQHDIAGKTRQQGVWLKQQLMQLQQQFACIGQVRGRGLMLGLEIIDPQQAPDHLGSYPADPLLAAGLQQACFGQGLLLERGGRQGNVLRLLPPLTITQDELQIMLSKLTAALLQVRGGCAA